MKQRSFIFAMAIMAVILMSNFSFAKNLTLTTLTLPDSVINLKVQQDFLGGRFILGSNLSDNFFVKGLAFMVSDDNTFPSGQKNRKLFDDNVTIKPEVIEECCQVSIKELIAHFFMTCLMSYYHNNLLWLMSILT